LQERLGLRRRHRRSGARPLQAVDRLDHHEERERDDQEFEHRLNKHAVAKQHRLAFGVGANAHREILEIHPTDGKPDRRHDDVGDQGVHDLAEGAADHDTDGEINDTALHRELFEFGCKSHVTLPLKDSNAAD